MTFDKLQGPLPGLKIEVRTDAMASAVACEACGKELVQNIGFLARCCRGGS